MIIFSILSQIRLGRARVFEKPLPSPLSPPSRLQALDGCLTVKKIKGTIQNYKLLALSLETRGTLSLSSIWSSLDALRDFLVGLHVRKSKQIVDSSFSE
jgi:hypothetical protein